MIKKKSTHIIFTLVKVWSGDITIASNNRQIYFIACYLVIFTFVY